MIQRDLYLHQLVSCMWDGQIKVITGIRRCGKFVLLFELFRDNLLSQGTSAENIIEKIVMRRDIPASFTDENGIRHINVLDFLLGKEMIF